LKYFQERQNTVFLCRITQYLKITQKVKHALHTFTHTASIQLCLPGNGQRVRTYAIPSH